MKTRVVIIGAGIGGLASAALLAKAGYEVSIFEKRAMAGGRAGRLEQDGFTFDTGPSWYLMPRVFEHFYELMGEDIREHLTLTKLTPAYKVFYQSHEPITITGNITKDKATFEVEETGAGAALEKYVAHGNQTYELALEHFLYTNFTSIRDLTKRDIVKRAHIMTKLAYTPLHRYVRRFVKKRELQQILEYPMVFLGSSPFSAPALYSLMSALDFKEGVYYPQGGLYEIIKSLEVIAGKHGVVIQYNSPVKQIMSNSGRVQGLELADGSKIAADIVISNADIHFTETNLLKRADRSYSDAYWQKREPGPSALLMYLGIKGKLPHWEHHNLLFVDGWQKNFADIYDNKVMPDPASIYICKPSATDNTVAPKGYENVFVLVPLPAGARLNKSDARQLADKYLQQIASMTKTPDLLKRITLRQLFAPDDFGEEFHAWQNTALGMSHLLKQSALFRTPNKSKRLSGLYYVGGNTVPGVGLPMCLISAELLYKRLMGERRGGRVQQIQKIGGR